MYRNIKFHRICPNKASIWTDTRIDEHILVLNLHPTKVGQRTKIINALFYAILTK